MSVLPAVSLCLCLLAPPPSTAQDGPSAASFLPASTIVYAEIDDPSRLLQTLLEHPVHERIRADERLNKLYDAPQMLQLKAGLAFLELQMGMQWADAINGLAGRGISVGFVPEGNQGVLILQSPDEQKLATIVERGLKLINKGREDNNQSTVRTGDYRGASVYRLDNVRMAVLGDRLVLTNSEDAGKAVIDAMVDTPQDTLADADWFADAMQNTPKNSIARAALDLGTIRQAGALSKAFEGMKENPVAEFLFGGVMLNLEHAPFIGASLQLDDESLGLTFRAPHDAEWITEPREFFYGPNGGGAAPAIVSTDDTILNITAYRDIGRMWLYAGDLFNQQVNDQLAEAESNLSTLFAGRDFTEEILAMITPELQLVVARQDFTDQLPRPALKLPSFALVGELREPEDMKNELRRTFQSVVGFFNVVGAMNGNPQLDQDIVVRDDIKVLTSSFVPLPEDRKSERASVHFNFSPSLAFAGDHFVLSSTRTLAEQLAGTLNDPPERSNETTNVAVQLRADTLQQILRDNRAQLVGQNMLEEGRTQEEAEQQIDLLLDGIGWFDGFSARLIPSDDDLRLQLRLTLAR